jgi:hypothetical protein
MRDNKVIGTVAGVVSLTSALGLALFLAGGFGPRIDPGPYEAVGRVLARQTLALLKPDGRVTVITRDTLAFQNPATDFQLKGFRKELAKAGVKIDSIEALQADPLRPMTVPAGDFFQWIKNSAKGNVIVSLMGPPILSDTQLAQLGEVKPAIIAFCSGPVNDQVDLRSLFSHGLLQAAVVSKRNAAIKPVSSAGERELFDRQFLEVTATNVAALSTVSTTSP